MYAYFDGKKWIENLSRKDIKRLVLEGVISPETLIRTPKGREAIADDIAGLEFPGNVSISKPEPASQRTKQKTRQRPIKKVDFEYTWPIPLTIWLIASLFGLIIGLAFCSNRNGAHVGISILNLSVSSIILIGIISYFSERLSHLAWKLEQVENKISTREKQQKTQKHEKNKKTN